jgi:Na+/proline symporter/signal transduction histidine kinase/CheY-like chemotaxis protein
MVAGWTVVLSALLYVCALFAVAHWADGAGGRLMRRPRTRACIYALSLAVYCTSWTFFGSVGVASRSGLDFLMIYVGPILVVGLGHPLVARVVRIAKAQNSTSIADFVAARYGKSERIAALVCVIALVGAVPYIALQLKAVVLSLHVFLRTIGAAEFAGTDLSENLALAVALVLAAFAVAFGTRHADATEHQDGLTLAVALESVVKLIAFLVVGAFIFGWIVRDGPPLDLGDLWPGTLGLVAQTSSPATLVTQVVLSGIVALVLPRQFHMAVVENRDVADVRAAAWTFPLYLVLINLFVIPLTLAGLAVFPEGSIDRDMTVLALPLTGGADLVALVAFLGGLSAATAMTIVESVAVAIMVSNHLVMPVVLRRRAGLAGVAPERAADRKADRKADLGGLILVVRRFAILGTLLAAYAYARIAGDAALAAIGLLSFAAVAQIGPAFLGGLVWRRGTGLGAAAGLLTGFATWAYTLLLPTLAADEPAFAGFLAHGPFGIALLRPTALLGLEGWPMLAHATAWSLGLNTLAYVVVSLVRPASAIERLQADAFAGRDGGAPTFRMFRTSVSVAELRAAVARYLGEERSRQAFEDFARSRGFAHVQPEAEADVHHLRFAEHLLASAIGAASARLALSLILKRRVSPRAALQLLDDASAAFQHSRDLLRHAMNHASQGITIFDHDHRLIASNRAFSDLYDLPPDFIRLGVRLEDIVHFNAWRGTYGPGDLDRLVAQRMEAFAQEAAPQRIRLHPSGRVIELRANALPQGGLVATYTDVTEIVAQEDARARANEELEHRVRERTEELTRLNAALSRAKAEAEEANVSKTRFLAAASHDILQPLNAARLYATALVERDRAGPISGTDATLAENVDASLDAVEEILTALLDISRLDTGALKPQWTSFRLGELLRQLRREFEPLAREKGVDLVVMPSSLSLRSDRGLLRRLLQNLISNAIKYTPKGRVLVGARRRGSAVRIMVCDTGLGIPAGKQRVVFREFQRLDQGAKVAAGLGLGLSIVERVARVLDHPLALASTHGQGTVFTLDVPVAPARVAIAAAPEPARPPASSLAGLTVLALDNEPTILDGMRTLLSGWGCTVLTAGSLAEAQARLAAGAPPHALIADFHLDEGDGLSAIEALRATLGIPLPAMLLTADRSRAVRERAGSADVHVLTKPLKPAALRALLAQWRATRIAAE